MHISHHRLKPADRVDSPNTGGTITPRFIVMHYTAGWTAQSAINTFKSSKSKSSAHLVIERDGEVTQMVPFNKVAWHAGPSEFNGFRSLNRHSIGIEIVNPGFFRKVGRGQYKDWQGKHHSVDDDDMTMIRYPKAGSGDLYWMEYTDEQLAALDEICSLLIKKYPILAITGHEDIDTRGWKVDPGPAFPMRRYKALLDERNMNEVESFAGERGVVTANALNTRIGPGIDADKVGVILEKGTEIGILGQRGNWYNIAFRYQDERVNAWASADYIRRK